MTVQRKRKEKCLLKGKIFKIQVISVAASRNKGCHFIPVIVTPPRISHWIQNRPSYEDANIFQVNISQVCL